MAEVGEAARARLVPFFEAAEVPYPPDSVVLVGLKDERKLEVYAAGEDRPLRFIRSYYVHAMSGDTGPKLREGDRQVPEGIYRLDALNPNSRYHLSLRVDYPNAFDRQMATLDARAGLGGDIFIHGGSESAGCLAMGDRVIEELFVLSVESGLDAVQVILSPNDLRNRAPVIRDRSPPWWTPRLYRHIGNALDALPPARWPRIRTLGLNQ